MRKYHFIIVVLLGMFFMPNEVIACGSGKNACKKEASSKQDKDNCCSNDSNSKTKDHKGCGGKCGHSKCGCTTVTNGFTATIELDLKNTNFDFSSEKQKFSNAETFISSGFYFLWLIPKIS